MKVLIIGSSSSSIKNFRRSLIKELQARGNKVFVVAFDDKEKDIIETMGVGFYCVNDENRSLNPLKVISLKNKIYKCIMDINPDIIMTFMLKPNIFGGFAAKKAKIKEVYAMVEGAGDVFAKQGIKWGIIRRIVCILYKRAFRHVKVVFFLNDDDKNEFIERKLVSSQKAVIINGIGVDLDKFKYSEVNVDKTVKFLMVARLMRPKGLFEYCKAAQIIKKQCKNVEFHLVGGEGTESYKTIQDYIDDKSIIYHGELKDVLPQLIDSSVFVLPSFYREGLPMSIMEAEAVGRAVITTNNVGCKETIIDGYNGSLIPVRDVESLKQAMLSYINDKDKIIKYGQNSRKLAEEKFDQKTINNTIISIISGGKYDS